MAQFLEKYYRRTGERNGLATVLSDMQALDDGKPADPAAWEDWLEAVRIVLEDARQ